MNLVLLQKELRERLFVLLDIETTGLERTLEILQIACTTQNCDQTRQFVKYLLPDEKNI